MRRSISVLRAYATFVSIHAPVKDATLRLCLICSRCIGFNPRTRKGCDGIGSVVMSSIRVSIHAPVKDATKGQDHALQRTDVSIHAPVKDATSSSGDVVTKQKVSIHAPVKDATPCLWKALLITFSAYNFANNKVYK